MGNTALIVTKDSRNNGFNFKRKITKIIKDKIETFKNNFRIYVAYFKMKFLNEIQYKIAAIAGILTQFSWGFMYVMLYTAFLKGGTSDYSVSQMCTYIWLNQAFFTMFNIWALDNEILEECRTGIISTELIKPVDLYYIWHSKTLGTKLAKVALRAIPILFICSMHFMGQFRLMPPMSLGALGLSIFTFIMSAGIMLAYIMIMYVAVMKTISSQGIRTAFYLIFDFCSGGLVPIPFMPDVIVKVLKFTPFYYMQNISSNIYNGYITNTGEIMKAIIIQIFWLAILTVIGKKMMKNQIRKIEVNGG